jgi:hypothetical protein
LSVVLTIDLSAFEARARELGGAIDQVPFALSQALNTAAFKARDRLITQTWPRSVTVRNKSFIRSALRVNKASKRALKIEIYDTLGRAHLKAHADGGTKVPKGGNLAIPSANVQRGASGVRRNQKPRELRRAVRKGNLIFQEQGSRKQPKLRLMYALRPRATIKPDVPFRSDFAQAIVAEARAAFPAAMVKAMRSRRAR